MRRRGKSVLRDPQVELAVVTSTSRPGTGHVDTTTLKAVILRYNLLPTGSG